MRRFSCGILVVGLALVLPLPRMRGADDPKAEPGFTLLFNGKNFDGWKTKKGNAALDGKKEAYNGRFKIVDGNLVIDPKVKGDVIIETAKEFAKDVHIKFEFNPGPDCNNDLFFRDTKFDIVPKTLKNVKEGEWNTLEIIAVGDKIEHKVNGEAKKATKTKAGNALGIRAEFGPIQIRNLQVKE
jgi:hypothetical protein